MSLKIQIQDWDGKKVQMLQGILDENSRKEGWIDEVLKSFDSNPKNQTAVTWFIKNFLEQGGSLNSQQTARVFSWLEEFEYWEPKLHLLQALQWMTIPAACKNNLKTFLYASIEENNKFVRAWAYNGFHILSVQYPEYKKQAQKIIEEALESEEAASIKARIRQILKKK